jgi:hypothetical protein
MPIPDYKMTKTEALSQFRKLFEKLSYSQDYSTTFNSFLDFALWRLAPQCWEQMKEDMLRLDKMYKPELASVMCEMFEAWSWACDNDGEGFYDALGDLFMECVSFGRNGQFFTPQPICDMMAELNYGDDLEDGKTVCDPACGSGRMLLAMGKLQRKLKFYGADNDHTCVKMAALNMMVNCMKGEIAWMNSLSMEHYKSYHINLILNGSHYLPVLTITGKNETYMINRIKPSFENQTENSAPPESEKNIVSKKGQLSLF